MYTVILFCDLVYRSNYSKAIPIILFYAHLQNASSLLWLFSLPYAKCQGVLVVVRIQEQLVL